MLRILHAADLHLDSPFSALTPEQAAQRRRLQRELPGKLTELCRQFSCDLLLLAGDVFDGAMLCPETVAALETAFSECPAQIFISPGNHDPYTADSPWMRTQWPEHVHVFSGPMEAVTLPEHRCRVWGAAFQARDARELLQPVPAANDGFLEIGVLHGDPLYPGDYNYLSPMALQTCGLDYLALGHIHQARMPQRAGKTWYGWPGTPLGRGFDETGEKGVFLVELSKERCEAKWIPIPGPRYEILTCPAEQITIPAQLEGSICRLVLTGEVETVDLPAIARQYGERFLSLEIRDETLPRQSLWADCGEETLRGLTLQALKRKYDQAETVQERQTAAQAARFVLAALEGRDLPW